MMKMIDIFIPSYHRPGNIKTVKYFLKIGYDPKKITVFIDDETDDRLEYEKICSKLGINLFVFDMAEARKRYDYVHRASISRRSAGQARNMFYDYAKEKGITAYCVQDDDTSMYQIRPFQYYIRQANFDDINSSFLCMADFMEKRHIGCFGFSQTGDMFEKINLKLIRKKVMNTTFYNTKYICRGERGVQDDDTSQFAMILHYGFFTGSMASGLVLQQTASAKQEGGLTDLYKECKLLNKSLIIPIQLPSCSRAEKQKRNGGRLHHRINYRYLCPKLMRNVGGLSNIEWDSYEEDMKFTLEPKRNKQHGKQKQTTI